ncbi:uncharacterized protein LOC105650232 [Jatropha curcas]|nr:uncharacterized protein LOC105650232 [Jatropha curcas]
MKVKEKLQKTKGVYYINIDTENGLVLVSGFVDPPTVLKTIGKNTQLLAYEKDSIDAEKKLKKLLRRMKKEKNKKDGIQETCSCDSDSEDDDDDQRKPYDTFYMSNPNNGIRVNDPRVFGGYRDPSLWYGRPYYATTPYGYPGINYPANYNRPRPPPARPQVLSNVYAVYGGQREPPVGNSLYHAFSDDNVRACSIM